MRNGGSWAKHSVETRKVAFFPVSNANMFDGCVDAESESLGKARSTRDSIDLYCCVLHPTLHFIRKSDYAKRKRILIAQSFFSWMNIDSHSEINRKKYSPLID